VSARVRRGMLAGLCIGIIAGLTMDAHAFFPFGAFDQYGRLEFLRWSWAALNDRNHDGDISGPNEGVEVLVEGGLNGFTDPEIEIVREAFQVWQDVPTSYIGFQVEGPFQDPVALGDGVMDLINTVSMELPTDLVTVGVGGGVLGLTFLTFSITGDELLPPTGPVQVTASPGQIIEADIVIDAASHRSAVPGQAPLADLKATLVHEIGHFLGLDQTPLNNLEAVTVSGNQILVESPVVVLRDATNTKRLVGATPTMFPIAFSVDLGAGSLRADAQADLAPDDIAGVSFMYPRGSQDEFFTIMQEARTRTHQPNLPSIPLPGGHVVAWCDVDNDPLTPRIPLFSTMSGLYEIQPASAGRFYLYGLYKVLETMGGVEAFEATYSITSSPMNELDLTRQAPPPFGNTTFTPDDFKSVQGGVTNLPALFPSEVFHEGGNVFDITKHDLGTPLVFDRNRSAVISLDSKKTLPTILPQHMPMFGTRNDYCPLNAITATGSVSGRLPTALRGLRDDVLLRSAAGTALVDAYYHVSPALARFLLDHALALRAFQLSVAAAEWCYMNYPILVAFACGLTLGVAVLRRRKRALWFISLLLVALGLAVEPAWALIQNLSDADMVRLSDNVVTGTVQSVTSQWIERHGQQGIVTDVAVIVDDAVKGRLNKSGSIYVRVPGGQVGSAVTIATDMPLFKEGEEVVLFLQDNTAGGFTVVAGRRGKFEVTTDTETGKKYITGSTPDAKAALSATAAKKANANGKPQSNPNEARVPLEDYKAYLRELLRQQQK